MAIMQLNVSLLHLFLHVLSLKLKHVCKSLIFLFNPNYWDLCYFNILNLYIIYFYSFIRFATYSWYFFFRLNVWLILSDDFVMLFDKILMFKKDQEQWYFNVLYLNNIILFFWHLIIRKLTLLYYLFILFFHYIMYSRIYYNMYYACVRTLCISFLIFN